MRALRFVREAAGFKLGGGLRQVFARGGQVAMIPTDEAPGDMGPRLRRRFLSGLSATQRLRDSEVTILVRSEATGGRLALIETVERPGGEPPCHRHYWEDELLYVLEGELALFIEGKWLAVPAGRAIMVPRSVEHTFAVLSNTVWYLTRSVRSERPQNISSPGCSF